MEFVMKDAYGKDIPQSAYQEIGKHYDDMPKAAQEFYDETLVFDELLWEYNKNTIWKHAFKHYKNVEEIKTYYDKLDLSSKMDFSESRIIDTYRSKHDYLREVDNQVMTAKIKMIGYNQKSSSTKSHSETWLCKHTMNETMDESQQS